MKWKSWFPAMVGDTRVKSWFALLPVKIGNDLRWLEKVTVEYQLQIIIYDHYWCGVFQGTTEEPEWVKIKFVDVK